MFSFAQYNTKIKEYLAQNIIMELNHNMTVMADMHTKIKAEVVDP